MAADETPPIGPPPFGPPPMAPADALEFRRRRRGRNIALLLALVALCLVFYGLAIVKMAGSHGAG